MNIAQIIIEPSAKQDICEVRDWYVEKSEDLSSNFRDELTQVFEFIACNPLGTAVAFGQTRLKPMRQFPYLIGYVVHNKIVYITGVQHGSLGWNAFENRDIG